MRGAGWAQREADRVGATATGDNKLSSLGWLPGGWGAYCFIAGNMKSEGDAGAGRWAPPMWNGCKCIKIGARSWRRNLIQK